MKKAMIIAAMAGCGKTCLARKYKDIFDLDHLHFKYIYPEEIIKTSTFEELKGRQENRTVNPLWPQNYFTELFKNIEQYKIILLPSDEEIISYLDKINFKYTLCYPEATSKQIYLKRYKERGTNQDWINRIDKNFEHDIEKFNEKDVPKLILKGDETLEDRLKEMGMI